MACFLLCKYKFSAVCGNYLSIILVIVESESLSEIDSDLHICQLGYGIDVGHAVWFYIKQLISNVVARVETDAFRVAIICKKTMLSLIETERLIHCIRVFLSKEQPARGGFGHLNDELPHFGKILRCLCRRRLMVLLQSDDYLALRH